MLNKEKAEGRPLRLSKRGKRLFFASSEARDDDNLAEGWQG